MKSLSEYLLTEAAKKDQLDISIKDVSKVFNTTASINKFLNTNVVVTEKVDGTKLTIVRNDKPYSKNYQDNWIIAFKGNVMYPEEYEGTSKSQIAKKSIGTSQYKLVHDHLKKVHAKAKSIPKNTEFFVEYVMNKPTLTRDYKEKHGMVLLAWSPTKYEVNNGRIKTRSGSFNTNVDKFAKALRLNSPRVLYKGKLGGIVSGKFTTPEEHLEDIKQKLLGIESEFGGKTEGVVIETPDGQVYKFLQADQHDVGTRAEKKQRFKMEPEKESKYFEQVRKLAIKLVENMADESNIQTSLKKLSKAVYSMKSLPIKHEKKQLINIQDDLFLTAKQQLIRRLKGNNGALFIGRFSPPTKAHIGIVESAIKKFDTVTVNIVKAGKKDLDKNPFPQEVQEKIWYSVFPKDKVTIQYTNTGNIVTALNKAENNINVVLAGSDRVKGYEQQLARNPDITVEEIPRTAEDVSATKARNALKADDRKAFEQNMDKRTWKFYDELKRYV